MKARLVVALTACLCLVCVQANAGEQTVSWPGDFNDSGLVDFDDFFIFADAFGTTNPQCDLDGSGGAVDFTDFFIFADNFGSGLPPNQPPTANAGQDQEVEVGETVTLDASASTDSDNDALTYAWTAPAGVILDDPTTAQPAFSATATGTYQFILVVNDGQANSSPDTVVITVRKPANKTVILPGGATIEFVWIEPGTFMMGSPTSELGYNDRREGPQHQVTLTKGFWLGKYELTQAQWQSVMNTTPWAGRYDAPPPANNPAMYISWNDIQGLVHTLNQAAGDSLYRLPTDAEWEYACRAGTTTPWSFGDEESQLRNYAWYDIMGAPLNYARPVGTKLPNPWGLYDMHGNIDELVQDYWFAGYPASSQVDPVGPATGEDRVIRGGSFQADYLTVRSASRFPKPQVQATSVIGVRLVRIK